VQYKRAALEANLPRIEASTQPCDRTTGNGCTLIPLTDDGAPAEFYPYFSIANPHHSGCVWQFGDTIPGTTNDFQKNAGYGSLLPLSYLIFGGGGQSHILFNDFRNIFGVNPCPASS
jgi:hypothetical protein